MAEKKLTHKTSGKVAIAGMWDLAWNTPIKEIDLWKYPLKDFAIDSFFMTPITGIDNKFVQERSSLEEIINEHKGWKKVFCDERATTNLNSFTHPKKALYIFGKANFSPFLSKKGKNDLELKIETPHPRGGLLWGHQAVGIILYDRFMKGM